jgi:XTP/dITP diphosphohydrolase
VRRLVLASRNKGKLKELQELLAPLPLEVVGLDNYPLAPEVAETGTTFTDNAILKAKAIGEYTHELTLADDSRLEVAYLAGAPGVYSARYGELGWNDRDRYEYLLNKLKNVPVHLRGANFRSVVAVFDPLNGRIELAEGTVAGVISTAPQGSQGFGYDPIFYLPEYQKTMAELPAKQKNELSHRGRAVQAIIPRIYQLLA